MISSKSKSKLNYKEKKTLVAALMKLRVLRLTKRKLCGKVHN